jgi:hypothetical protein
MSFEYEADLDVLITNMVCANSCRYQPYVDDVFQVTVYKESHAFSRTVTHVVPSQKM